MRARTVLLLALSVCVLTIGVRANEKPTPEYQNIMKSNGGVPTAAAPDKPTGDAATLSTVKVPESGKLKVEDRVVGVGQGRDGEIVDVVDMKLSDVVAHAGLALYAEIALILFFLVFVAVLLLCLPGMVWAKSKPAAAGASSSSSVPASASASAAASAPAAAPSSANAPAPASASGAAPGAAGNQTAKLKSLHGLNMWVLDEAEEMPDEDAALSASVADALTALEAGDFTFARASLLAAQRLLGEDQIEDAAEAEHHGRTEVGIVDGTDDDLGAARHFLDQHAVDAGVAVVADAPARRLQHHVAEHVVVADRHLPRAVRGERPPGAACGRPPHQGRPMKKTSRGWSWVHTRA